MLLEIYTTFNELVIKKLVKSKAVFVLMKGFRLPPRQNAEAATGGVLKENLFLVISQNSQKSICARVSFLIKLQASASEKRDSGADVFMWILWSF